MSALPSDDYMRAYLKEAMRLYHAALPTATDAQRLRLATLGRIDHL